MRILSTIIMSMIVLYTQAQTSEFGLRMGFSMANTTFPDSKEYGSFSYTSNGVTTVGKKRSVYGLMPTVYARFNRPSQLFWQMEFGFSRNGFKQINTVINDPEEYIEGYEKIKVGNIQLPIFVGYRFANAAPKFYVMSGITPMLSFRAKYEIEEKYTDKDTKSQEIYREEEVGVGYDGVMNLDIGFTVGAGMTPVKNIPRLAVDTRYTIGIYQLQRSHTLSVALQYSF